MTATITTGELRRALAKEFDGLVQLSLHSPSAAIDRAKALAAIAAEITASLEAERAFAAHCDDQAMPRPYPIGEMPLTFQKLR